MSQDPNQLADAYSFGPNYMFNASEVSNEFNVLNDFLNNSLVDEASYQGGNPENPPSNASLLDQMAPFSNGNDLFATTPYQENGRQLSRSGPGAATPRQSIAVPYDKAKEKYFMEAADPAGSDTPEERMNKLLKAKYDAGLLKPFNYVNGYVRLQQWMEKNLHPSSREKIMRQFNSFRPNFRARIQQLNDLELVKVEMWFELKLMEYDRVFASMAIPACCWRRTGEIFRGNSEMAELIRVPLEDLRDVYFPDYHDLK